MSAITAERPDLRLTLRRPTDALPNASIGLVPILWNNVDLAELRLDTDASTILDEVARIGFEGTQLGLGFPEGADLRSALDDRGLRLAEVYLSLPSSVDGPAPLAMAIARERLRLLHEGGGDVLCVALGLSPDREGRAGRADDPATPRFSEAGWRALGGLVDDIAAIARDAGHRTAFHPHAGTFVETPAEVERLVAATDPALVGVCLDVAHYMVGGGDPVRAMTELGDRVSHVHLKDVDGAILDGLRAGRLAGFGEAIRARLFTELGAGVLDLDGVIGALASRGYGGWLMVEQDSGWGPPSESAAISRHVLAAALRRAGSPRTAAKDGR
jgi:inosose dehydratase